MTISVALFTYLSGDSNITSVVSSRIYPLISPQNPTAPYVTYDEGNDNRQRSFDGQNVLTEAFFDVDAWAETYAAAKALQKKLITSLKSFEGTISTIPIFMTTASSGPDVYEDQVKLYRCNVQILVSYKDL